MSTLNLNGLWAHYLTLRRVRRFASMVMGDVAIYSTWAESASSVGSEVDRHSPSLSVSSSTDHQLFRSTTRGCFTTSSSSDFFKQMQNALSSFASGSRARAAKSRFSCLLCHVSRCLRRLGNSRILLLSQRPKVIRLPRVGEIQAFFCPQVRAIGWWSASLLLSL